MIIAVQFGLFQQIMLAFALVVVLGVAIALWRGWIARGEGMVALLVALGAATAFMWPVVTSKIAHALGIGRGADLLLYVSVVLMFIGFWMTYTRLRKLRRDMTLLVRQLAIEAAERDLLRGGAAGADDAKDVHE